MHIRFYRVRNAMPTIKISSFLTFNQTVSQGRPTQPVGHFALPLCNRHIESEATDPFPKFTEPV